MRKNFFKKLSFVMALAMIVSVIAPAAGVFAATGLKLNKADKTLHLSGEPGSNKFNFNIDGNKEKGWKYEWTSSNEEVAEVNTSNGVTVATGIGKANITVVITDKKGAEVDTLTAKVTVKDNIKTVTIANAPEEALEVGEEYDFNRSFVTLAGSTKKTTAVTKWSIAEDTENATIVESNGVFKATTAGKYTVVARSFQSNAKYEEWQKTGDAKLLLDDDSVVVEVKAGIVEVKQVDLTKFTVEFDSDMSKTDLSKDKASVAQLINGRPYVTGAEKIKSVTLDASGKKATVELYASFIPKTEYTFTYGKLEGGFKAASTGIEDVEGLVFDNFNVDVTDPAGVNMLTKLYAVDKNGVKIIAGTSLPGLTFTYKGEYDKGYASGSYVFIYKEGYTAEIQVVYKNAIYNDTTKTYDPVERTATAFATGTKTDTSLDVGTMQYAVNKTVSGRPAADSNAWGQTVSIPAGDGSYSLFTRYKNKNNTANDPYTYSDDNATFKYEPTNADKLIINATASGVELFGISEGATTVLVKKASDNAIVGSFDVVIKPSRSFQSVTQDNLSVYVGNNSTYGEVKKVTVTVKDSMGEAFTPVVKKFGASNKDYEILNKPNNSTADPGVTVKPLSGNDEGKVEISVDGKNASVGVYYVHVALEKYGATKDIYVTVQVVDSKNNTSVASWQVELSDAVVDLKENYGKDVTVKVAGYNSSNVKVTELATTSYTITVKKDGNNASGYTQTTIPVVSGTSPVVPYATGTYVVTAYATASGAAVVNRPDQAYIAAKSFEVKDTTAMSYELETTVVGSQTVSAAVKAAYKFNLNGSALDETKITEIEYSIGGAIQKTSSIDPTLATGTNLYISKVKFEKANANSTATKEYTFTIGATIRIQ